jgi:hypothetical protein
LRDPEGAARVEEWLKAVPEPGTIVTGAETVVEGGKPILRLTLSDAVDDIFVEAQSSAYFRSPLFSGDGHVATLVIDNVGDPAKLKGQPLTLTYRSGARNLEQTVTLP